MRHNTILISSVVFVLAACGGNETSSTPAEPDQSWIGGAAPVADFSPRELAKHTALSDADKALLEPAPDASPAVIRGYELYQTKCETCHGYGYEKGATLRLDERYEGDLPAVLALRTDLIPEMIETFVRQDTLGMPPFRVTELSDSDLDVLSAYLTRLNPDVPSE